MIIYSRCEAGKSQKLILLHGLEGIRKYFAALPV
jgi:hypothetical protein